MRVTVEYMAQLRRVAGCAVELVEAPSGISLTELLERLGDLHGPALGSLLVDGQGRPHKSLLFFVGDERAEPLQPLHEGARVTILAPMAGG